MSNPAPVLASFLIIICAINTSSDHCAAGQQAPESNSSTSVETIAPSVLFNNCADNEVVESLCGQSDLWTRPTMTGDWNGLRSSIQDSGVTLGVRESQLAFGVSGGVNHLAPPPLSPARDFKYTGHGEYDALLNLEKIFGLPKGTLLVRLENWYGQYGSVSLNTGAFSPTVFPAALPPSPENPGTPYLTNFLWTQPLSQNLVVFAGKKDVLGSMDQDIFAGGDGTDQFVNQALVANPAFLLGLPYTSFTTGFVSPQKWGQFSSYIYDPTDRTMDAFRVDNLFSKGVIIGGEVKLKTNLFEMPGEQHVGGMWKHVPLTNLKFQEPPPGVYPEPTVPGFPTLNDSYTVYYGFDQYLVRYLGSDQGFGLFGRASISDGNPTPVRFFLSGGIGGYSPIRQKQGDMFGLGWYYVGASNQFGPIPQALYGPRNGTGVELYYKVQVTPWCSISPDLQYVHPEAGAVARDSFVYGFRANTTF